MTPINNNNTNNKDILFISSLFNRQTSWIKAYLLSGKSPGISTSSKIENFEGQEVALGEQNLN